MSSSPLVSSLVKKIDRLLKTARKHRLVAMAYYRFVSGRHNAAWQSTFAPIFFQETLLFDFWRFTPGTLLNHASFCSEYYLRR